MFSLQGQMCNMFSMCRCGLVKIYCVDHKYVRECTLSVQRDKVRNCSFCSCSDVSISISGALHVNSPHCLNVFRSNQLSNNSFPFNLFDESTCAFTLTWVKRPLVVVGKVINKNTVIGKYSVKKKNYKLLIICQVI